MDIRLSIDNLKSKQDANVIAHYVLQHNQHLNSLMYLLFGDDADISRKAARVLAEYCLFRTANLGRYFPHLIQTLRAPLHQAVSRNLYLCLMRIEIPKKYHAELFSICISDLLNSQTEVAVKANAMSVAYNLSTGIQAFKNELELVLLSGMQHSSAAYKARATTILKGLRSHRI